MTPSASATIHGAPRAKLAASCYRWECADGLTVVARRSITGTWSVAMRRDGAEIYAYAVATLTAVPRTANIALRTLDATSMAAAR